MQPAAVQVEKISRGNFARGVFSSHPYYRGKSLLSDFILSHGIAKVRFLEMRKVPGLLLKKCQ